MLTPLDTEISNLVNAGLMIEPSVTWITDPTIPYGFVISINPVGGSLVSQWTYVSILVSIGPSVPVNYSVVPNVVGLQQYYAHQAIGAAGLTWNFDTYAYSPTVAQTYVISQTLTAGAVVPSGSLIQIAVSLGVQPVVSPVTVPVVTGNVLLNQTGGAFVLEGFTGILLLQ